MHIIFYRAGNIFKAEDLLEDAGIAYEIVPVPVQDKAYCGVCIRTKDDKAPDVLNSIEYYVIYN